MYKKFFLIIICLLFSFPPFTFAQEEFLTSYDVLYDVYENGETQVTEKITFKNLTDKYFASSFTLAIGVGDITNITAFDSEGNLETKLSEVSSKSQIQVTFNKQAIGKNKTYSWTLKFTSRDFAQKQGQIWQVLVPKISAQSNIDQFDLSLAVPVGFGDPTIIVPQPKNTTEIAGKIHFDFTKEQLQNSGLMASFGEEQFFDFKLIYKLKNNSILPQQIKAALPANRDYQQIIITKIHPKPQNVTVDRDGNYIAWFKLGRREIAQAVVEGKSKLSIDRLKIVSLTNEQQAYYTAAQKYWEKDNPSIKLKLIEILANLGALSNQQRASLINNFVAKTLEFDFSKRQSSLNQRLGGVTALRNPDKSLCTEFADLFISLARAADLPARLSLGYAFSSNNKLRPVSFDGGLHCWAEYFDPLVGGWLMVDPTWQSTTGGVDFSRSDLNHLVIASIGSTSDGTAIPERIEVTLADDNFVTSNKLNLSMDVYETIFAGLPSKAVIRIENQGNFSKDQANLIFNSGKITTTGITAFSTGEIPPMGVLEHQFDLRAPSLWSSFEEILQLQVDDQTIDHKVIVKPFFAYKFFSEALLTVTLAVILIYSLLVFFHFKKIKADR